MRTATKRSGYRHAGRPANLRNMPNGLPSTSSAPAEQALLAQLPTMLAGLLTRQLGEASNFLECDFRSSAVIAAVEQWLSLQKSHGRPVPSCTIHKLRMRVARNDSTITSGPTSHIAVLLSLPTFHILIDSTHLQYDLPFAVTNQTATALRARYSAAITGFQYFTFHDRPSEPIFMAWRNFIAAKPTVRSMTGVELLDKDARGTRM